MALQATADWITCRSRCSLATLLGRWARNAWSRRRRGLVRIRYPQRTVDVPRGWSVLEASRAHGIPHLSVCGGRARCSTCRVQVVERGAAAAPLADEQRTLARIGALPCAARLPAAAQGD